MYWCAGKLAPCAALREVHGIQVDSVWEGIHGGLGYRQCGIVECLTAHPTLLLGLHCQPLSDYSEGGYPVW